MTESRPSWVQKFLKNHGWSLTASGLHGRVKTGLGPRYLLLERPFSVKQL
jgi:hypothetical protein